MIFLTMLKYKPHYPINTEIDKKKSPIDGGYKCSDYRWGFMRCPYCKQNRVRVIDTTHDSRGAVRRRRECENCGQRFSTLERPILATPLIVKQNGMREEFNSQKLRQGILIACAKRPVSGFHVDRLVGEVESSLQALGKPEVTSRVVGDLVISGLKELDLIAYIRYAIVYLGLDDLQSIRREIDRLLEK
jgi:transcriptional repressor NrdR